MSKSENELKGDKFESGIFWELYKDLERQFVNFLEYVPYLDGNETVCSFSLLNSILSISGYVDSAFKEMARYPKFSDVITASKELQATKPQGRKMLRVRFNL